MDWLTSFQQSSKIKELTLSWCCFCIRHCSNISYASAHLILIIALRNRYPPLYKLGSGATQRLNNLSELAHIIRSRGKGYHVRDRGNFSVWCRGTLGLVEAANPVNFPSLVSQMKKWRPERPHAWPNATLLAGGRSGVRSKSPLLFYNSV